jgi:hypothetical protein
MLRLVQMPDSEECLLNITQVDDFTGCTNAFSYHLVHPTPRRSTLHLELENPSGNRQVECVLSRILEFPAGARNVFILWRCGGSSFSLLAASNTSHQLPGSTCANTSTSSFFRFRPLNNTTATHNQITRKAGRGRGS